MDWGTVTGGMSFAGFLAMVAVQIVQAISNRKKISAEAGKAEADREVSLSEAATAVVERLTANYEARLRAVQEDAKAQIASVRAEMANNAAAALHEVSTARSEASSARRAAEEAERQMRHVRMAAWAFGPDDPRIERIRTLVGDGGSAVTAANGTAR